MLKKLINQFVKVFKFAFIKADDRTWRKEFKREGIEPKIFLSSFPDAKYVLEQYKQSSEVDKTVRLWLIKHQMNSINSKNKVNDI